MPFAVTHVILTIIAVDLYRDYLTKHKKYFTLFTLFIAGIGGLLPDLDIVVNFFLRMNGIVNPLFEHGGLFHTLAFSLIFLIPFAYFWKQNKKRLSVYFLVLSFGIVFHIFLDWLIGGGSIQGVMPFYPITDQRFGLFLLIKGQQDEGELSRLGLDSIILLAWLFYLVKFKKIKDYI